MPYPQPPKDKQYGTWFPEISTRAVPEAEDVTTIDNTAISLHPSEGGKTSETLGPPKKIDMGVLRVWLSGGTRKSRSFDDGPSFDHGKHDIKKETDDGEDGFNLAPGTDEKSVKIHWQVYGLGAIKSAKLELFGRDNFKPLWEHHWGDAWGKKKADISDFAGKSKPSGPTALGELPFTQVVVDKGVLPKGLLNLKHSPYQLRLTVSGCTAANTPAKGDQHVYPMTAWTYLHVLVESFQYEFGKPEWIDGNRPDVDPANKDKVVAAEKLILEELRAFVKGAMQGDMRHYVALRADHNKGWGGSEFDHYASLWGDGARVPLVTTVKIKTLAGTGTTDKAAEIAAGAKVFWDWSEPDPKRPETLSKATKTFGDGKTSKEFLEKLLKESSKEGEPSGSFNCPTAYGGKLGDKTKPFFVGGAPLPFTATAPAQRKWALITDFDDEGKTGVILRPSRFAGDAYKVHTYLHEPELDTRDELEDPATAVGSPGAFEVQRRATIHHVVVGDLAGLDAKGMRDSIVEAARKQVGLALDFAAPTVYTGNTYAPFMKEVMKNLVKNTLMAGKYHYHGLELPNLIKTGAAANGLVNIKSRAAYRAIIEAVFQVGAIRVIKPTPKLDAELARSQYVEEGTKTGCVLDLEATFGGEPVYYLITFPVSDSFTDGATLTDPYTGKTRTATFAKPIKSCWTVDINFSNVRTHGKEVVVKLPGVANTRLSYKKGKVDRKYSAELLPAHKSSLKQAFENAVNAFNDGEFFTITIEGHEGTSRTSTRRIANVRAYLTELASTLVIQRRLVLDQFEQAGQLSGGDSCFYAMSKEQWATAMFGQPNIYGFMAEAVAYTHAKQKNLTEGLVVVHSSRFSTLTDTPADRTGTKTNKSGALIDSADFPTGGYVSKDIKTTTGTKIGLGEDALAKLGLVYLVTPDPGAATTWKGSGNAKKPWAIMLHEIGHGLWLPHAKATRTGQPVADSPDPAAHVADDPCLMSYDGETDQFCGMCMVRLRGWKWTEIKSTYAYDKRNVTISIGDLDSIFTKEASKKKGKMARAQVLGLFNRPLGLNGDPHFGDEFKACWDYSWELVKKLVPGVDADPETKFAEAIKGFVFEDGKLPAPTEQGKLRVFGHYHPYYANMDVAMRYGDATKKDSLENQFKMMAIRGDVEARTQGANPAIGAYPLDILVTDESGAPAPGAEVWVKLVDPAPATVYDPAAPGKKVLGATSFVKGTGGAPITGTPQLDHVKKWIDAKIVAHDPSAGDDPQRDNVHFELGGKRKMWDDGNVGKPKGGIRNVFTPGGSDSSTGGADLPQAVDSGGAKVKHAVMLTTDEDGIAQVLFTPSTVGGDRYKIEVTVRSGPDKREVGKAETGTMVMWRAHRVAEYLQMPNAANDKGLPPYLAEWRKRFYAATDEALFYKPLATFNLRKIVGDELARSYCEVLFEDEALAPRSIGPDFWVNFKKAAADLSARYSVEECAMYQGGQGARVVLNPVTGSANTWRGRLVGTARRGNVAILFGRSDFEFSIGGAVAHDYDDAADDTATEAPFKKINANDYVYGMEKDNAPNEALFTQGGATFKAQGATVDVDEAKSKVNYTTGEVIVVFKTAPPVPAPAWKGANSARWGNIQSVTGATLANTAENRLWVATKASTGLGSGGKLDFLVYKSKAMAKSDLVAAATKVKNQAGTVTCKPKNKSGLTLKFDVGDEIDEGQSAVLSAGMLVVYAAYFPEQILDQANALDTTVTSSPWLLNYLPASKYNERHGPDFTDAPMPMSADETPFEKLAGAKADYSWAETIFMRALASAVRDQGFCFYPGQIYVQANYFNPIQGSGLGGKGIGNTALLFPQGATEPDYLHYLVLHETGHCLYGIHAPAEPGNVPAFHDEDGAYTCIMAPANDLQVATSQQKSARTFCGKCNAGLRGVLVMEDPLYPASESSKPGSPPPGNAGVARRPVLGSTTGGLVLPLTVPDPHTVVLPTVPDDTPIIPTDVPDLDDDDVICATLELIAQAKSNWCWAAASLMMRKFYGGETITQCQLAGNALFDDGTDCCDGKNDAKCNIEHALVLESLTVTGAEGTKLTFDQIKDEIDNDRPFIVAKAKHYLVCYGYSEKGGTQTLILWDPLPVGTGATVRKSHADYESMIDTAVQVDGGPQRGATYYNMKKK